MLRWPLFLLADDRLRRATRGEQRLVVAPITRQGDSVVNLAWQALVAVDGHPALGDPAPIDRLSSSLRSRPDLLRIHTLCAILPANKVSDSQIVIEEAPYPMAA